nr:MULTISPECIES: YeeE/YedE thiosulfate transporter family protein [Arsenicicoccus]
MYALFSAVMKYGALKDFNTEMRSHTVPGTTIHDSLGVSPWVLVLVLVAAVGWATVRHLSRQSLWRACPPAAPAWPTSCSRSPGTRSPRPW